MNKIALLLLASMGLAGPAQADDAGRYADCMKIVRQKPQAALDEATAWRADQGGVPAMHCQALALIELGQPGRAAGVLDLARDTLAREPGDRSRALAAMLAAQSGNAWMLANDPVRARDRLTRALDLYEPGSGYRVEALIDRARAAAELRDWATAVADLTAALASDAARSDALLFRATAWRKLDKLDAALDDIAKALALAPGNPDMLFERGVIYAAKGERDRARADWTQVAAGSAPDAAREAKAALAQLDAAPRN